MSISSSQKWVPLHVHSQYSILDGTASIEDLVHRAKKENMEAIALTDQGNMYGAVEFYKACVSQGIKPIIGCELYVAPFGRDVKKRTPGTPAGFPLIFLAKDKKGYQNLCKLSSLAHVEGFYYTPRIDRELIEAHSEGLICLSGPLQGRIAHSIIQGKLSDALEEAAWLQKIFGEDFYFELQRHTMSQEDIRTDQMEKEGWLYQNYLDYVRNQSVVIKELLTLSQKLGIKCVATNDTHYLDKEDWKAHEILMNIQSGEPVEIWEKDSSGNAKARGLNPKRQVYYTHELYFKSAQQMALLFEDIQEAVSNSLEIANKISFQMDFKTKYYPMFVPPDGSSKDDYLRRLCEEGISKRYTESALEKVREKYPDKDPMRVVNERLAYELDIIISKGMCDYLLIVHDFIAWSKSQGIPVGPGRGSGAGSIILFLTGITDIEPLRFNLFFERFINPERLSYPDIDVDICMERRSEVIDYTVAKYGKDRVAQIITFGTMKAKMAVKDVGRVLSVPLTKVNAITKLVPEELNITLDRALEVDADLRREYETDPEVKELIDFARKLEGSVRNTGTHAAGVIISAYPLTDLIPVCNVKDSEMLATQFSMKPVEAVGMLKIDFLGLKTLTSIQKTVDAIHTEGNKSLDWVNLPLDDKPTFSLLNYGKMLGIFQLESGGMQELVRQLHIDKFEEIIAVVSLYRPGPMEMIPSFINRKHGKELIENDHPLMKDVLDETYGIMVYQEQVMQIASLLASYSLGEGDVLRRAMGKKDREEMSKQREKFRQGALEKNIDPETSMRIFDKIEKFASYGFNKSHAAAYGYLSYVTAYLKANYPGQWMAALMTCDRDDTAKVAKVIGECQAMSLSILPPDVNESKAEFVATSRGIRFAMSGIKGVGEGVVESIVQERAKNGPFRSLFDFFKRMDSKKCGKKTVENLIEAGAFDFTNWSRQSLLLSVEPMHQAASKQQKELSLGIVDLFAQSAEDEEGSFATPPVSTVETPKIHRLKREKELLGFYLTGHPLDEFKGVLQRLSCVPLKDISQLPHDTVFRAAFIVEDVQVRISNKSQKKFAIFKISDGIERLELPIWPDLFEEKAPIILENQLLYAVLQVDRRDNSLKLQCRWLDDLSLVDEDMIRDCDAAYDQAKHQVKNAQMRERAPQKPKEPPKEKMKHISLKLDGEKVQHTHILEIKNLFRSSPGSSTVHLEFWVQNQKRGTVEISSKWGVSYNEDLGKKLKGLISVQSITLTELDKIS